MEGELGRLSLGELAALSKEFQARERRQDWRAAMVVCAIVNVNRGKDDPPIHPEDVMPWLREEQPQPERQRSPQEMRELFEQLTREMGGIVHPRHEPLAGV